MSLRAASPPPFTIRPLQRDDPYDISWVAQQMQQTLMDVMGAEKGRSYYSLSWLQQRVQWHLDLQEQAQIWLAVDPAGQRLGQAIVRRELDPDLQQEVAYFSTLYVAPDWRRQGVATALIASVHDWGRSQGLTTITYSTARDNHKLLKLLERLGYTPQLYSEKMVKLRCSLGAC